MHGSGITPSLSPRRGYASSRMTGMHARFAAFDAAQASRQRSRLGLTLLRPVGLGMYARLAASDAWLMPHALAPALAWLCLVWLCMHARLAACDAWIRPHLALTLAWSCLASYGFACMLDTRPLYMAQGSPLLAWLCMHAGLAACASDAWRRPHALALAIALALAWLCLASYGGACMLGPLPLMHGSGLRPSLSRCLASYGCACMLGLLPLRHGSGITPSLRGSASPRMAVHAR